jgi:hypothetical protein
MTFIVIEIPEDKIGDNILDAYRYMVEDVDNQSRWFGSNDYQECVNYINTYGQTIEE